MAGSLHQLLTGELPPTRRRAEALEKPNRTANCTGVVDHGSQVFTVSPVAENQSAIRAVACRWWESIQ
jgi:hypothetical protein